jgi:DnaK suppressor protein
MKKPAAKPVKASTKPKAAEPKAVAVKPKPQAKPMPKPKVEIKAKPPVVEKPAPQKTPKLDMARKPIRPEPVEVIEPVRPSKPAKAAVDMEWQIQIREMMTRQRHELLSVVESTQAQMAEKQGDLPDVSDRASEGFEDELAVGLMAIEAAKLDDIEAAIQRIDDGSYGLCMNCGKPIPRKRLEVLPFARRCLTCEGENERKARTQETETEEEDND